MSIKPVLCTITPTGNPSFSYHLHLPAEPEQMEDIRHALHLDTLDDHRAYSLAFECATADLEALFQRIPEADRTLEAISEYASLLQAMDPDTQGRFTRTILDWTPLPLEQLAFYAKERLKPAPLYPFELRELQKKVDRDFFEEFDGWYDRMGFVEGQVYLADSAYILRELRAQPLENELAKRLLCYKKPFSLIHQYWEGDMRSFCREDFESACRSIMEADLEDNFELDPKFSMYYTDLMKQESVHQEVGAAGPAQT